MPKVLRFDDEPHRDAPHDGALHDGALYDGALRGGAFHDGAFHDGASHGGAPGRERAEPAEESPAVRVIVKVNTGGYVPDGFRVRTRVDDELFTAEASEADLTRAAEDPQVDSVARARPLGLD